MLNISKMRAVALLMVCLWSGASCHDSSMVKQSEPEGSQESSPIETNIQRLRDAQARLSKNPKDKEALSTILTLLKDRNGINRSNAAAALGEVGEEHGATLEGVVVPLLIDLLKDGDEFDKYAAVKALRGFSPHATAAIPILRKSLSPGKDQQAWIAAEALGKMNNSAHEAVPDLLNVIKTNQNECLTDAPNICKFAAQALGNIGVAAKVAVPDLLPLVNHRNPYFRIYLAIAFVRIDPSNQEALTTLSSLLKDQNTDVRRRTLWGLREIGKQAKPAKGIIQASLEDGDEEVRSTASQILQTLGEN